MAYSLFHMIFNYSSRSELCLALQAAQREQERNNHTQFAFIISLIQFWAEKQTFTARNSLRYDH